MIQINATLHTKGGVTISTGSVIDVKPHFITPRKIYVDGVFDKVLYDITYDAFIYKNMAEYKKENSKVLVSDRLEEFNIGYHAQDVDIQSLTSMNGLLDILRNHIENGNEEYPGVGAGKTVIVYPTSDVVE